MVNYYGKFLSHFPSMLAPLYQHTQKHARWTHGPPQEALMEAKKQLTSSVLYDPDKNSLYASPYGEGAVLSHKMEDGSELLVA